MPTEPVMLSCKNCGYRIYPGRRKGTWKHEVTGERKCSNQNKLEYDVAEPEPGAMIPVIDPR